MNQCWRTEPERAQWHSARPLSIFVTMRLLPCTLLLACPLLSLAAQAPPQQRESDAYTRYELLAPGSAKFRIIYEVTATTAGATHYFNPIRKGSIATDESVIDRATGKPLAFDVVGAAAARVGGVRTTDTSQTYIRVTWLGFEMLFSVHGIRRRTGCRSHRDHPRQAEPPSTCR